METGCTIAVKAEHQNPGGSVKDRAALYLIKEAEEKGEDRDDYVACREKSECAMRWCEYAI